MAAATVVSPSTIFFRFHFDPDPCTGIMIQPPRISLTYSELQSKTLPLSFPLWSPPFSVSSLTNLVCAIIRSLPPAFPPATSLPTAAAAFSTPLIAFSTWELTFSNSQTSTPKTTTKNLHRKQEALRPSPLQEKKKKSEKLTESSRPRRREDKATKTKETQNETHTHTQTRATYQEKGGRETSSGRARRAPRESRKQGFESGSTSNKPNKGFPPTPSP
ncbi:unnamed protein product [Sphagnum troendelagicum]|uniref:Uncharacterized protein n=1 Tax=Sphagnum troendelagicum TaxID=128251 RepID=A0ABP0UA82_9BRYO